MNSVYLAKIIPREYNISEIFRFMGVREADSVVEKLVKECISECEGIFSYNVCYGVFPVSVENGVASLPFVNMKSKDLSKLLADCEKAVVFAATVGIQIDRLIFKYGKTEPSKAVAFQAIGAERIEALCDAFCDELKNKYEFQTTRFSPGYGDLSIEYQRDILNALDTSRKMSLTLNSSFLMSPSKSVTAIIGVR